MTDKREPNKEDFALWNSYLEATENFEKARRKLFRTCGIDVGEPIVELVRSGLTGRTSQSIALDAARRLTPEAQQQLFDELLPLAVELDQRASYNRAERIILSLPRDWLIVKLREVADSILANNGEITSDLLGIFFQVDRGMTHELVEKVLTYPDDYSQDIGSFFLEKLNQGEKKQGDQE